MEPYLSLASRNTGSGSDSQSKSALPQVSHMSQTANIKVEELSSLPNKRNQKFSKKQTQEFLERRCEIAEEDIKSTQKPIHFQSAEQYNRDTHECDSQELSHKRRKISDENWTLSENLLASSPSTPKISERVSNEIDFQNIPVGKCLSYECEGSMEEEIEESPNSSESVAKSKKDRNTHSKFLHTANSLCTAFNGKLLSQEVVSGRGGNDGLSFQCCNKHQFIISLSTMSRLRTIGAGVKSCYDSWCLKCRNFYRKTQERAQSASSTILSSDFSKGFVEIKCINNHKFTVAYTTNHTKTWCEECKDEENHQRQTQWKERQMTEEQRKQKEQQKLFEESYKHMQRQQQKNTQRSSSDQEAYYLEQTMKQVCTYAKLKMESEVSSPSYKGDVSHVEIYNMYKILYMPSDVLVKTLCMIGRQQLSSYYRQIALLLHPDKNKHEMSNDAFKKLGQAYELCKQLI